MMAPFKLTPELVHALFDPTADGNWEPFIAAVDPEVHWIVNDPAPNPLSLAGTYVRSPPFPFPLLPSPLPFPQVPQSQAARVLTSCS